jgi:hypothetical protein
LPTTTLVEAGGTTIVRCPNPGCARTFTCDACLHVHLMRSYRVKYADAFGAPHEAWLDFCEEHAHFTPSMLGL